MTRTVLRNRFALLLAQKAEREGRARIPHEEVSDKTGIGTSTISRYANNKVAQYANHVILALCNYLECEPGDLLVRVEVIEEVDSNPEPESVSPAA